MLQAVRNPQGKWIRFEYDALGRRTAKIVNTKIYRYLWDGNVLLHEWFYESERRPKVVSDELGMLMLEQPEPVENLTTWVYEEGSLVPTAKLCEGKSYSIVSDYLGRPAQAYDDKGELIWQVEFDIYGRIREDIFNNKLFIPFRQLGQYEDVETGLYYNRFRYYDSNTGTYISQDPIKLEGNNPNFYAYVSDSNTMVDVFGLMNVWDIQFSQSSISDVFNEGPWKGLSLDEAIEATKKLGKLPEGLTLNVMELNGGANIVTLNNRTLYVAQQAGLENIHPNFVDNINKLNKLLDGGIPLDVGEIPKIKCKK